MLVITIIVLGILAVTAIVAISNTNVVGEVSKTAFKSDMSSYKEAFELYVASKLAEDSTFVRTSLKNLTYSENEDLFKEIFGKVESKYQDGLKVVNGQLVYETDDDAKKEILESLAMEPLVKYTAENVPIPSGFYYVGGTKDTGLVISDKAEDKNRGVGEDDVCIGNQFVWVPVDDYLAFERGRIVELDVSTNTYKLPNLVGKMTSFEEPYSNGYSTEQAEYEAMRESVKVYGGFYIARFEAGDGDAEEAREDLTEAHTVVSKKGAYVYNYVPWGSDTNDITPSAGTYYLYNNVTWRLTTKDTDFVVAGAVYLSQQMAKNNNYTSVVSTLCYGVQWDATMNFISDVVDITDSTSWGNHSNNTENGAGALQTTGYSEKWKAKNIYDLAGNVMEWTMEECRTYNKGNRSLRGESFYKKGSYATMGVRNVITNLSIDTNLILDNTGFRPTLYIVVPENTTKSLVGSKISTTSSCVGLYADVDGDGEPDGVIFADLAHSVDGYWYASSVADPASDTGDDWGYTAVQNVKDYVVIKDSYEGKFGAKPVIQASSTDGNDRFYVMALEDFTAYNGNLSTFLWYVKAYYTGGISAYGTLAPYAFGTGRSNTQNMITKWESDSSTIDLWAITQEKVYGANYSKETKTEDDVVWFVPSINEWAAFAAAFDVTQSNYSSTYGLSNCWSSSLYDSKNAYFINFEKGYTSSDAISLQKNVRLATTF